LEKGASIAERGDVIHRNLQTQTKDKQYLKNIREAQRSLENLRPQGI
jgi:hypothetical protein